MNWQDSEHRSALLRLWETGVLKKTQKVRLLAEYLLSLGWITQSARQNELLLNENGSAQLPALMDNVWPLWRETLDRLQKAGLPLTAAGLQELGRASREFPAIPGRLHHKTFAALAGAHSKCLIDKGSLPPRLCLTTDGTLRTRPNRGLIMHTGQCRISCDDLMRALGEIDIPERAILDGIRLDGILPKAVMTVENLGPFVDMPKPDELFFIHQPGWNTALSRVFLQTLGVETAWHHFGDLDPEGLAIFQHLRNCGGRASEDHHASPRLFIPAFWHEYRESYSHPLYEPWPKTIKDHFSDPLLQELFAADAWLEQEPIVLDKRLEEELMGLVRGESEGIL